jgi:hypothetical protein
MDASYNQPSELEREIAQLERLHDQLRDRVKGLEATLEAKKMVGAPDAGRIQMLLDQARSEFRQTREDLEAAWAKRQSTQASS